MVAAPNATVVVNWFLGQWMGETLGVSPLRQRGVSDALLSHAGAAG